MALPANKHVIVQVLDDGSKAPNGAALPAPEPPAREPKHPREMSAQELRAAEGDIIDDLFRSDDRSKQRVGTVAFERIQVRQFEADGKPKRDEDGELVFGALELRLRPLRQSEIDQERRRCGRIWEINADGQRVNEPDSTELAARMVLRALVPEDRQRYLEDKRMWAHFGTGGPIDTLDAWLTPGELQQAGAMVLKMSNIQMDARTERLLGEASSAAADV